MAKRPVVILPDPLLRTVSEPIEKIDGSLQTLIDDMFETMKAEQGLGLAAVQVGVTRRLLVLDLSTDEEPQDRIVMINPKVLSLGKDRRTHEEGCLSIPDVRFEIERPASVVVSYTDRHGKAQERDAKGLLATAIQHEIDHLDGKMIIDYVSRLKRDMIVRKFKKLARQDIVA